MSSNIFRKIEIVKNSKISQPPSAVVSVNMSATMLRVLSTVTVEPIVFLASFSLGLMEAPNLFLYFEKVCTSLGQRLHRVRFKKPVVSCNGANPV
jgi:hypothetical protein